MPRLGEKTYLEREWEIGMIAVNSFKKSLLLRKS